jgi:hypothetical protein
MNDAECMLTCPPVFFRMHSLRQQSAEKLAGHIGRDGEVPLEDYVSRRGYPALLKWELEEDCASR